MNVLKTYLCSTRTVLLLFRKFVNVLPYFQIILMVFGITGGILAIQQLLSVVLACCYANQIGELYESFVRKRALMIYQSQSKMIKVMLYFHT